VRKGTGDAKNPKYESALAKKKLKKYKISSSKNADSGRIQAKKWPILPESAIFSCFFIFPEKIFREKLREFSRKFFRENLKQKLKNADSGRIDQFLGELGESETDALITQHRCLVHHRDIF